MKNISDDSFWFWLGIGMVVAIEIFMISSVTVPYTTAGYVVTKDNQQIVFGVALILIMGNLIILPAPVRELMQKMKKNRFIKNPVMFGVGAVAFLSFLGMFILTLFGKAVLQDMNIFLSVLFVALLIVCSIIMRQAIIGEPGDEETTIRGKKLLSGWKNFIVGMSIISVGLALGTYTVINTSGIIDVSLLLYIFLIACSGSIISAGILIALWMKTDTNASLHQEDVPLQN